MHEKSPVKTTQDSFSWPFYPRYLTQIVPEEVLRLLLAGIVERLDAPLIMWEMRNKLEPIYPVERLGHYPEFCKILSLENLQHEKKISPQGSQRLKEMAKRCGEDSQKRAGLVLSSPHQCACEDCPRCHLGLITCSMPVEIAEHRLAVCVSGKFIRTENEADVIKATAKFGLNESDLLILKKLIQKIPRKSSKEIKEFTSRFQQQIKILSRVAEIFVSKSREALQWQLQTDLGSRFNRIFLEKGSDDLRQRTHPILNDIRNLFNVSFVALFCSAKPGDTVLQLFAQVGCDDEKVRDVTFNWKKASLSIEDDFDSYEWLRKERKKGEYPSNFLNKAIKGVGRNHLLKASFFLPYLYGNRYRGIFLMGHFPSILPSLLDKERANFLCAVGHLVITRILALVAIEALKERGNWRELMTRLWAHGIRSDLQTLIGETYEFEKRAGCTELLAEDQKRLKIAVDRMNETLEEMKNTAKLAIQAPDAAISTKIDRTELKREYCPLSVLIHNCVERIRKSAKRMNISIEVEENVDDLPGANVDLRLIGLVFQNILDNALKYSKTGSKIRIYGLTDELKQWANIRVKNYGQGIHKENLSEIFQLGYRSRLSEGEEGAGLGLYQANRFVELHDGHMRAESWPAFNGASIKSDYYTTITVVLPSIWRDPI
ncbi:MAG: PocR ligand-binding domain-containing protein [Deltaproteobacteria bacterium]|nr:PocR ligand-binding domain-containing protein [Deltaproteobacteria bacterium]